MRFERHKSDLFWIPRRAEIARGIRAGMPSFVVTVQEHFALYDDDADESTATIRIAKDTNGNVNVDGGDVETQLRFCVQQTNGAHNQNETLILQLRAAKNGGTYLSVNSSRTDGVFHHTSSNLVTGDDTTERLAGSLTYITNNNWECDGDSITTGTLSWTNGTTEEAECVFSVTFDASQVADGDYFDFELRDNNSTPLSSYTRRPRYTIQKSPPSADPLLGGLALLGVGK